jgi:c-di-GMP-binding flagellar brake protein YcgR
VYDWHGNLLLASGYVIENAAQAAGLLDSGYFQDSSWDAPAKPLPPIQNVNRLVEVTAPPKPETAASEIAINMEDVRWHIGETLYLQLQDKPAMRYSVKLIGFVKGKTIFVTAPTVDGKYELIREGQTFVARAFSGKKAYAFISSAVKSVHTPHPYLHLSYPKQLRCTVVRQTSRVAVRLISAILLGSPERNAAGTITDLSMGGASVVAKEPLGEKGEAGRIKVKLHVADQDSFLNLKTVLRAVTPVETGQGYRHGFEFVDVPVSDRLILSAFVHQTLVETD